jgi:hypothetical protein
MVAKVRGRSSMGMGVKKRIQVIGRKKCGWA